MQIERSTLALSSAHAAAVRREHSEVLRTWVGPTRPDFEGRDAAQTAGARGAGLDLSARARQAIRSAAAAAAAGALAASRQEVGEARTSPLDGAGGTSIDQLRIAVIEALLSRVLGRNVRIHLARIPTEAPEAVSIPALETTGAAPARAGWGLEYDAHDTVHDSEETAVAISGEILTTDGARLRVSVEAVLRREFHADSDVSVRAGDGVRKDPLVLHFDGPASALGEGRFAFDLDGDGTAEAVPTLGAGSGFLVLDTDGDGLATDGRELFGPSTGDGFAELARYDEDGNGWIDDGDSTFERLRIWRPAADGAGSLETLEQRGVGAIGLERIATPFEFRDAGNRTIGVATSTSLYLTPGGSAGLVQQIDLVV